MDFIKKFLTGKDTEKEKMKDLKNVLDKKIINKEEFFLLVRNRAEKNYNDFCERQKESKKKRITRRK